MAGESTCDAAGRRRAKAARLRVRDELVKLACFSMTVSVMFVWLDHLRGAH